MVNKFIGIFFMFFLMGCGDDVNNNYFIPETQVEREFQPFVRNYQLEADKRLIALDLTELRIEFSAQTSTYNCFSGGVIKVNPFYFDIDIPDYIQREMLVFQMITYCYLNTDTFDNFMRNADPLDPTDINIYTSRRELYIDRIFGG